MNFSIRYYQKNDEDKWDVFVLNQSMNGLFLQTRKFLGYHRDGKFQDCSLCVYNGKELVAVLPACTVKEEGKKVFYGHKGSTFGGIVISKTIYRSSQVNQLLDDLISFLRAEKYDKIYLKMVPTIYQKEDSELLDYFLYYKRFYGYAELNYYMTLERYSNSVVSQFSSSKRRDYNYSLKNDLIFRELLTEKDIENFYSVLELNLNKLKLKAVHSLEELFDLKFNRFYEEIRFFGVFYENIMIAGSMVFIFNNEIFHTQYLSSDEKYLNLFPMDYLITNLIQTAVEANMKKFSFGICTENQGRSINLGLSRFKEGFGTEYCINRTYELDLAIGK